MSARLPVVLLSFFVSSALLSVQAAPIPDTPINVAEFAEISRGQAGRLLITYSRDPLPEVQGQQAKPKFPSVGLRGAFDNGRHIWLDRTPSGAVSFGIGYVAAF